MTSIFPGGNALNAANITKKQQDQSAVLMEKISNGKRLITGADDAGNINKVNNLKAKVLSTKAAIQSVTDMMSLDQIAIGKIEDVDVAKTVVSLQKSNYIQQIATAMVNRVKSTMEAVLQMLER